MRSNREQRGRPCALYRRHRTKVAAGKERFVDQTQLPKHFRTASQQPVTKRVQNLYGAADNLKNLFFSQQLSAIRVHLCSFVVDHENTYQTPAGEKREKKRQAKILSTKEGYLANSCKYGANSHRIVQTA